MSVQITCINKANGSHFDPHEAVSRYGWFNPSNGQTGIGGRQEMVDWVKAGGTAYVKDQYGNLVYCQVRRSVNGTEFLQTIADGRPTDNLLSLTECPWERK